MAEKEAKQLSLRLRQGYTAREVVIESNISSPNILLVTGVIVIWIVVWVAIILFGIVTRKTNKLTQARKQSDEQVRLLLDSTAEAIFGVDTEGRCTFCNPMTVEMLGYQHDAQLLGKGMHALMHHTRPDGSFYPESECRIGEIFSSGQGVHCDDEVFWRADGTSFPVVYRGHTVRRDGEIVGAVVTFLDISEKLHTEHEVHKLSQVVAQASDAVFVTNSDGIIEYLNPSFEKLTGYTREELVGTKASIIGRAYQESTLNREMSAKLDKGEIYSGVRVHTRKNGEEFYAQETVAPLRNANGDTTHFVYTFNDISRQLEQEANIQSIIMQKQNAEQANLEKSSFLANMSHELRTPLNAIIGYSELLEEELQATADQAFVEDAKKINTAGYHLLALINDILDFSKIEAGKLELYTEEIALKSLLQEVITIMIPMMDKGHNRFIHNIDSDPGVMFVDVTRLRQCLLNLLSNAAKFTERGVVTLSVRRYIKQGQEWILFIVSDTGVGIVAEKIPKLFGEFVQAESSTTRRYGGTGLGLAISRCLIRLMGGDITVESEPGRGANFTINMPVIVKIED